MQKQSSIYFAHPINTYGTSLEQELLAVISGEWPFHAIVNPADGEHKEVVQSLKATDPNANVMGYFLELVRSCDSLVALPFLDGKWGKGVYDEAKTAFANNKPVWKIEPSTQLIKFVLKLDPALCLSVEETRKRVYLDEKRTIRPYV